MSQEAPPVRKNARGSITFSYIPMTGVILAFKQYQYKGGIYHSPWIGLQNFKSLMIAGKLGMVTRNTLLYNIAFILLGVVFEMGSAILINELTNKYFKKISQSFMRLQEAKNEKRRICQKKQAI